MIEMLIETTGEAGGFNYPPHEYHVDKKSGKLVAFRSCTTGILTTFDKPMRFEKKYRKFQKK